MDRSGGGGLMRVLVTGGSGFVGSAVARALAREGNEVRVLVRGRGSIETHVGEPIEAVEGDLTDPESLDAALDGCDELYHVAAHYDLWSPDPRLFYRVNVDGTREIIERAVRAGVQRIVYTSTVGAVGLPRDGTPGTEETPLALEGVKGHYKRSKFLAEREALRLAREGAPVVVVNPSAPMGPGDVRPTPTGRIILDFARGRMPAYLDTGLNIIHVDDVAEGHRLAARRGRIGERYILGHENLTLREILELLSEIVGRPAPRLRLPYGVAFTAALASHALAAPWGRRPSIPLDGVRMARRRMFFDAGKAVRELGLPQRPAREALADAYRWFVAHGYLP
jgi:dihydroflavonol-4-reductase